MSGNVTGGLFERITDDLGGGSHAVDAFQFQREAAQLVGQVADGPASHRPLRPCDAARAVQPPLEFGGLKSRLGVFDLPKLAGIKDADGAKGFREVVEAGIQLVFQQTASAVPLALQDDRTSATQLDVDVRRPAPPPPLGPSRQPVVAEELGEEDVGGFFADVIGSVPVLCGQLPTARFRSHLGIQRSRIAQPNGIPDSHIYFKCISQQITIVIDAFNVTIDYV